MNSANNNTIDSVKYSFYNIETGIYKAYFNGDVICCLSLIKSIKTKIPKIKKIKYKLNKNDSYLIYKHIKDLKPEIIKISKQYYCNYNIELISRKNIVVMKNTIINMMENINIKKYILK